ncbi:MAG TPA: hypothetical protein VFZ48_03765 [Candidatus Saccharimonadales bacterium]
MKITQSENSTPQLSLTVKAPIDTVWNALRQRQKLAQWFGWNYEGLEAEINDIYFTNAREEGATDTVRRSLAVNGDDTFILLAQGDNTELQLVRRPLDGTAEDNYYDTITEGWISFVEQLRFMLECKPDDTRKTIVTNQQLDKSVILEQLGISDAHDGQVFDGSVEGIKLSGSVQFVTPQQIGLLVNGWGPGLLIIQFSENMQLLTAYEPEEETFRNLTKKWSA